MNKRWLMGATLVVAMLASAGAGALAATGIRQWIEVEYRSIQIEVDGQPVSVDAEPFLHLTAGRVFIPARPLAEALGGRVQWDGERSIVKVYTRQYATSRIEGDLRVWSMPGAGFEMRAPLGWLRQPTGDSALLHLALPDASGLNGLVGVTQLPASTLPLATQLEQVLGGMRAVYADLTVTGQVESSGQVRATATARVAGQPVGLSLRLLAGADGSWLLFGLYPEGAKGQMQPAVDAILDSFVLR